MKDNQEKMTIEEYQEKYTKPQNMKVARSFLVLFATCIGVIIFTCLFLLVLKLFDINQYAGYAGSVVAAIVFVVLYVVPLVKMSQTKSFMTNIDKRNAREAKKYNKQMRQDIADKMIDINAKTTDVTWYSDAKVEKLIDAKVKKDDKALKYALTEIYDTDVRNAANKLIRDHAFKVGMATALSQSEKLDTLFVTVYDLNLIKNLIYLYGFRPNDAELAKIYKVIIVNALTAYGIDSATSSIATGVVKKLGSVVDKIPVLGSAIGTVIDSVTQGIINSSLTVAIGFQTKKYLKKEYHLQDILDDIDLSDELEEQAEAEVMNSVKDDITKNAKAKKDPALA